MSQLALALEANVSARHVSFIEVGRARPSRSMVLMLAEALDVPLRERNALLGAAGYAAVYRENRLDAPELDQIRKALDFILLHQEPYPAVVMDRHWNILRTNQAATRLFGSLLHAGAPGEPPNVLRLMFDPHGVRPFVANWEQVAQALLGRVRREAVCGVPDAGLQQLIAELLSYPGIPTRWQAPELGTLAVPLVPVQFRKGSFSASYFSTVTTLGTPQDITLQEIRIECFFPADSATDRTARRLAASGSAR
jgi:transcriptional regulator with XRE-family HTH domain